MDTVITEIDADRYLGIKRGLSSETAVNIFLRDIGYNGKIRVVEACRVKKVHGTVALSKVSCSVTIEDLAIRLEGDNSGLRQPFPSMHGDKREKAFSDALALLLEPQELVAEWKSPDDTPMYDPRQAALSIQSPEEPARLYRPVFPTPYQPVRVH